MQVTEKEKIILIDTILSFVEEVHKGKSAPGPVGIARRLQLYTEKYDRLVSKKISPKVTVL